MFLIAMALAGAGAMQLFSDLNFVTAFLSLAPAAVTEMVLVAKVMDLDAATVAAFPCDADPDRLHFGPMDFPPVYEDRELLT